MTDTVRTVSYLLSTAFPDTAPNGAITPQVMRDLVVSLQFLTSPAGLAALPLVLTQTSDPAASGVALNAPYLNGDYLCFRTV